jgi:hypothetical protein
MTARRRRTRIVVCLLFATMTAVRAAGAADDNFKRGMEARADKKWSQAEAALRRAVQDNKEESTRTLKINRRAGFIGGEDVPYLPYYFLGDVQFEMKNYVGALESWAQSEAQGVITRTAALATYAKKIEQGYDLCEAQGYLRPTKYNEAIVAITKTLTDFNTQATRLVAGSDANSNQWNASGANWAQRYGTATQNNQSARAQLEKAKSSHLRTDFDQAKLLADGALNDVGGLDRDFRAAVARTGDIQRADGEVRRDLERADSLIRQIDAQAVKLPANLVTVRQTAFKAITDIRDRLPAAVGNKDADALAAAQKSAGEVVKDLNTLLASVQEFGRVEQQRRIDAEITGAAALFTSLDKLRGSVQARMAQQPGKAPPNAAADLDKAGQIIERGRRRFEQSRQAQDLSGIQQAERSAGSTRQVLESILAAFGPLTLEDQGVPLALQQIVGLFIRGDLKQTLAALDNVQIDTFGPWAVHASAFRAAALFALYVRSGETDATLLKRAIEAVADARVRQPEFRPDRRLASPRFLQFYENGGASPQAPTAGQKR